MSKSFNQRFMINLTAGHILSNHFVSAPFWIWKQLNTQKLRVKSHYTQKFHRSQLLRVISSLIHEHTGRIKTTDWRFPNMFFPNSLKNSYQNTRRMKSFWHYSFYDFLSILWKSVREIIEDTIHVVFSTIRIRKFTSLYTLRTVPISPSTQI